MLGATAKRVITEIMLKRQMTAHSKSADSLAGKLATEQECLSAAEIAGDIEALNISPESVANLAVYALQKARRLLQARRGVGTIDPYTLHLIRVARAQAAQGRAELASSMARTLLAGGKVEGCQTRYGSATTANTQVCSSRQALLALGVATVKRNKGRKDLVFDLSHPLIREVA